MYIYIYIYLSISISISVSLSMSIYLPVYLSTYLSLYIYIYVYMNLYGALEGLTSRTAHCPFGLGPFASDRVWDHSPGADEPNMAVSNNHRARYFRSIKGSTITAYIPLKNT